MALCLIDRPHRFQERTKDSDADLRRLRYKDLEFELVDPHEASEQEIDTIVSYLQRSPHSFQWFRENTEFQYTDKEFSELVDKYVGLLGKVTIVSRDETKRKSTPGLPGMRLTSSAKENIRKALQKT